MINIYAVYKFIKMLTTPFKEWEAFSLGIIDDKGNVIKKARDRKTVKERSSFTPLDNLTRNIKRMLAKVPAMDNKLASYATALFLIKEHNLFGYDLVEDVSEININEDDLLAFVEETMSVGNSLVYGVGDDKPIIDKKKKDKYIKANRRELENENNI